jgi:hypothetical protein
MQWYGCFRLSPHTERHQSSNPLDTHLLFIENLSEVSVETIYFLTATLSTWCGVIILFTAVRLRWLRRASPRAKHFIACESGFVSPGIKNAVNYTAVRMAEGVIELACFVGIILNWLRLGYYSRGGVGLLRRRGAGVRRSQWGAGDGRRRRRVLRGRSGGSAWHGSAS